MQAHLCGPILQLSGHGESLGMRLEADALLCSQVVCLIQCLCTSACIGLLVQPTGTLMGATAVLMPPAGTTQRRAPSLRARRSVSPVSSVLKSVSRKSCAAHSRKCQIARLRRRLSIVQAAWPLNTRCCRTLPSKGCSKALLTAARKSVRLAVVGNAMVLGRSVEPARCTLTPVRGTRPQHVGVVMPSLALVRQQDAKTSQISCGLSRRCTQADAHTTNVVAYQLDGASCSILLLACTCPMLWLQLQPCTSSKRMLQADTCLACWHWPGSSTACTALQHRVCKPRTPHNTYVLRVLLPNRPAMRVQDDCGIRKAHELPAD